MKDKNLMEKLQNIKQWGYFYGKKIQKVGYIARKRERIDKKMVDLKGRSFLTLKDFTKEEIEYLLDLAGTLKANKKKGICREI